MAQKKEIVFSDMIADFCNQVTQAIKDYEWAQVESIRLNQLQQDYLHLLELEPLNYAERAKLATKLRQCRIERRKYKNTVVLLQLLAECLAYGNGKDIVKNLREVLGKTRKAENHLENRMYFPRILTEDEIQQIQEG